MYVVTTAFITDQVREVAPNAPEPIGGSWLREPQSQVVWLHLDNAAYAAATEINGDSSRAEHRHAPSTYAVV
jgi:hypothetical protein